MKAVNFGTVQGAAMPCKLQWFVYLHARGLRKGDDWLTFYSIADTHTRLMALFLGLPR